MTRSPLPETPRVLLIGSGAMADRFMMLLSECEVRPISREPGPVVGELTEFAAVVLASERPLPGLEAELDEGCWRAGTPWTAALLVAQEFRIGPTVVPRRTPCHECWRRRVRSQTPDLAVHDAIRDLGMSGVTHPWFTGALAVLHDQVAGLLAAEVMSLLSDSYPFPADSRGRYWQGNAVYGHLQAHIFSYVGTCNRCVAVEKKQAGSHALRHYVRDRFADQCQNDRSGG
jgi:bacteriocin biosynthesis cyclodehydratase domain-containing protein